MAVSLIFSAIATAAQQGLEWNPSERRVGNETGAWARGQIEIDLEQKRLRFSNLKHSFLLVVVILLIGTTLGLEASGESTSSFLAGKCEPASSSDTENWDCRVRDQNDRCADAKLHPLDATISALSNEADPGSTLELLIGHEIEVAGIRNVADRLSCEGFIVHVTQPVGPQVTPSSNQLVSIEFSVDISISATTPLSGLVRMWPSVSKAKKCHLLLFCSDPKVFVVNVKFLKNGSIGATKHSLIFDEL